MTVRISASTVAMPYWASRPRLANEASALDADDSIGHRYSHVKECKIRGAEGRFHPGHGFHRAADLGPVAYHAGQISHHRSNGEPFC